MQLTIKPDGTRTLKTTKTERLRLTQASMVLYDIVKLEPDGFDLERLEATAALLATVAVKLDKKPTETPSPTPTGTPSPS